jgi:tetratricopeptide (TPR) repeat protein
MLGQTLRDRYHIIGQLKSGGFGETYLAEDRDLPGNPLCVVKQLKPKDADPSVLQTARRLFDREAQVLYRLGSHDRIPQLFAHFEQNQEFYLVQEFIDGDDLGVEFANFTSGEGCLREPEAIALLQDVLETLVFVHQQNVIHRDIKPSNLIRRRVDGKLILIDFGAVKEINTLIANPQGETSCTILVGSPGYMPNEQQGGKPRFNSDIYGLGITAIQGLTAIVPDQFQEDPQTGEIIWRQYAQVSEVFAAILDRMVRSHFRDRYQSASEVLNDLRSLENFTAAQTQYFVLSKLRQQQFVKSPQLLIILVTVMVTLGLSQLLHSTPKEEPSFPAPVNTPTPTPAVPEAVELFNQGSTLVELRRYDEAIVLIDKVLQFQPNYPQAWVKRGEALLELQKNDEALKAFEEALKFKSDYAPAWYGRSKVLDKLQRHEEALAAVNKAVQIQPDDATAWYFQGELLDKLQRYEEALAALNQAVQIKPDDALAWYQRGAVLNKLQRYDDALISLGEAVQHKPAYAEAWRQKGEVLRQLQRYEAAVSSLDKALQLDPNSPYAWGERGQVLGNLKRYDEALAALDKAVGIKQDYADAWYNRGIILEQMRRYEEAIGAFDRAAQIKPDYSQAWYRRGAVLEKMRKYEEAIATYDKAIQIWPANTEAIENRKRLLGKLKR